MIYRKDVIIFFFVGVKFSFELPANENDEILHQTKISRYTVVLLEECTRGQAANKRWFQNREGRIIASTFKAAAKTKPSMPSVSLIKRICYPRAFKFSNESTRYSCTLCPFCMFCMSEAMRFWVPEK